MTPLVWLLLAVAWASPAGAASGPLRVPASDIEDGSLEEEKWWNPLTILIDKKTTTTTGRYDCEKDLKDWQSEWPEAQQRWCCINVGNGCPALDKPTTTTTAPYNCQDGFPDKVQAWSVARRRYCCVSSGRGCLSEKELEAEEEREQQEERAQKKAAEQRLRRKRPVPTPYHPPGTFDCTPTSQGSERTWSASHREFCCRRKGVGCETTTSTTETETTHDCMDKHEPWTDEKRDWCCRYQGRGCSTTTLEPTSTAAAATTTKAATTSVAHTTPTPTTPAPTTPTTSSTTEATTTSAPEPYECRTEDASGRQAWSKGKKAWCCIHKKIDCQRPYDCNVGYWKSTWSGEKRAWCCSHEDKGCPTTAATTTIASTTPGEQYDCDALLSKAISDNWVAPQEAQAWCCKRHMLFCPGDSMPKPMADYNGCQADLQNFQKGLPVAGERQEWCCSAAGLFCSTTTAPMVAAATTEAPFDCKDAYSEWSEHGLPTVPQETQQWCCSTTGFFCAPTTKKESTTADPMDCQGELAKWRVTEVLPSSEFQDYCCSTAGYFCGSADPHGLRLRLRAHEVSGGQRGGQGCDAVVLRDVGPLLRGGPDLHRGAGHAGHRAGGHGARHCRGPAGGGGALRLRRLRGRRALRLHRGHVQLVA